MDQLNELSPRDMLPISSTISNRLVTKLYYSATKRCLFGHDQISSAAQLQANTNSRFRSTRAADKQKDVEEPPQLATAYFNQFPNYCQMVTDAKSRAKRSVLIDHCGLEHIDLSAEFSNVEHVYSIERDTNRGPSRLSLIEFKSESDADDVARRAKHTDGLLPVPLKVLRYYGQTIPAVVNQKPQFPVDLVNLSSREDLISNTESLTSLVTNNMMSLVALKLRFITLVNFERVLCAGIFEEYELMPFGSSVIDIGCDSGDLDLVVTRKDDHKQVINEALSQIRDIYNYASPSRSNTHCQSQLFHLDKSIYSENKDIRAGTKGALSWFDHILKEYMPLTDGYGVVSIRHAKVPIIKFTARITAVDCDLSFNLGLDHRDVDILTTNYSGIVMSQLLYSLCRNNNLFSSAVIYLRIFGKLTSITSKEPNVGMTNFQYLSLIIFYLQQISLDHGSDLNKNANISNSKAGIPPVVPPFRSLLDPEFDIQKSPIHLDDNQLEHLVPIIIRGFLKFYSHLDFSRSSLNLYNAKIERKMDNSSIFVLNPLDRTRNVCNNVNRKGLEHFIKQVRSASTLMQGKGNHPMNLIRNLIAKQRQQSKKARLPRLDYDMSYNVSTGDIAQDVCR